MFSRSCRSNLGVLYKGVSFNSHGGQARYLQTSFHLRLQNSNANGSLALHQQQQQQLRLLSSKPAASLLTIPPQEFIEHLQKHNITRCWVVFDKDKQCPVASHPELQELADFFREDPIDFMEHEGIFMNLGQRTQCLLGAFVWRTCRGQAVCTCTFVSH